MRFFSTAFAAVLAASVVAAPPSLAPDFAQPQSPTKSPPFEVKYVDQGKFDPRLKGLLAPEGFVVELVADAPTVVNPVGLAFAPDGTLFALEWKPDPGREWQEMKEIVRYKDGTTRQIATMKKFVTDPVKVLRYNPAKKMYDSAQTIIAEELPSSLLWHDGWLYTASRGSVRRYRQSNPGGQWDVREVIAQGFCGFHHHQVSGVSVGNDGRLYITSGDDDNFAEGSDGSRATVLRTGAVFRCKPDGSKLETFSIGYRNPYRDIAHDDKFNWFHADNDNEDGSKFTGCRLVHVAEEVDYGWRLKTGARCCRPDPVRGAVAGELPGKLPPMLKTGRGSPAGVLIYNDTQIPEAYRGLMYYPDVFRKVVRAYTVKPKDSSFQITHEFEFLKSDDPLFRPCHMVTGPDGAIYVCDWRTDSGGAGKLWGDGQHGRIYRMRWAGTENTPEIPLRGLDSWAKILRLPDDKLVSALNADALTDRVEARKELVRRGDRVRPAILKGLADNVFSDDGKLVALGALQSLWNDDVEKAFREAFLDGDENVRRVAIEGLALHSKPGDAKNVELLTRRLSDPNLAVRRAAALGLSRIGSESAADSLVNAWKAEDSRDPFLQDAYLRSIERLGKPGLNALLSLASSGHKDDLERVADAFTGFRTRAAAETLPQLLANPHLTGEARAELVRSYSNYLLDPPLSLEGLAELVASRPRDPTEMRVAALDVLGATGNLGGPKATALVVALIDDSNRDVRLAAIQAADEGRVGAVAGKLVEALSDSKRNVAERTAILKAVRVTSGNQAVAPLTELLNREEPADLKVEALRALAAIAPNQARPIAEKFLEQPDPGLIAESILALGTTKDGAKLVAKRYLDKKLPRDLFPRVSEVLRKFPGDAEIAKLNGEVMKGGLILSLEPSQVEKIRNLVQSKGDPKKGKALYLNTAVLACASCHRMEGVGGQVGPDLTRVWDTHTVEKIIESIVEPSKEIKEGYQTYQANTADGRVFTGLKVVDTPKEVVLREPNGRDVRLAREDIDKLEGIKTSLMPGDVVSQLSYEQFIDLVAFLKSRQQQESLRGAVLDFSVSVGYPADLKAEQAPEKMPDPAAKLPNGKTWQAKSADPNGLLSVKPLLPPGDPAAAYALAFVFSPSKQTVSATYLGDDPVRIAVAGKPVFERAVAKLQAFQQEEKFDVELPAGWSPILIKVVSTGRTHQLGLTLRGKDLRTAAKPDSAK